MMTSLRYRWTQLLSFLHTRSLQGSHTAENLQPAALWLCLLSNSPLALYSERACLCVQPIVGELVIHNRAHLLLRPSKSCTSGDEILQGHIKASRTRGWTVKEHQRGGVVLFLSLQSGPLSMDRGGVSWSYFQLEDVSKQTHLHKHRAQPLKVVLPGTSINFLYTFKKAASASLLLLLKASICKDEKLH